MNTLDRVPLFEVCVGSVLDAERAVAAGADRLELCAGLEIGGLTPSFGCVMSCLNHFQVPMLAMIRPRAGGFNYDDGDFNAMLRDVEFLSDTVLDGFVLGVLTAEGQIDQKRVERLVNSARGRKVVFHRAFDVLQDLEQGLNQLIDLGVTRVLTSGGCASALDGAGTIRRLKDLAQGRIEILPGGGIRPENIVELLRITGCDQVHLGASIAVHDPSLNGTPIVLSDSRCLGTNMHREVDPSMISLELTSGVARRTNRR